MFPQVNIIFQLGVIFAICHSWLEEWCVHKRNARVLGTERTGASQTCPAHRVGPLSSLGHAQNARTVRSDISRHVSWFVKARIVTAVCFLGSVDGL